MSVNYSAKAVIGVRINPDKLYAKKKFKAFDHNFSELQNFCSQTGRRLWIEKEFPIDGYDAIRNKLFGFPVVYGTDGSEAFICVAAATDTHSNGGNNSFMTSIDINLEWQKQKLKNVLLHLEMWDDAEFGLWAVLRCCY